MLLKSLANVHSRIDMYAHSLLISVQNCRKHSTLYESEIQHKNYDKPQCTVMVSLSKYQEDMLHAYLGVRILVVYIIYMANIYIYISSFI